MSDTINLAGKNIIVDSVDATDGGSPDLLSMRLAIQQARSVNAGGISKSQNKEIYSSIEDLNESVDATIATLSKIGAIKTTGFNGKIDVFAYNPTKPYDASYSSDYYVSMGYVIRDGVILPVAMPTKYKTFTPATKEGVWAICIYKENIADEVYLPIIACPYANGTAMKWYAIDSQGTTYDWSSTDVALKSLLVIGSFDYTALDGVYNLFVIQGGQSPQNFLNYQFLDIMGKAVDGGRTDFSNWATAMKVDQIFERLAVLELFVSNLYTRNLTVGTPGSGFSFQALSDDGNGNKVFDVRYNSSSLFHVVVSGANAGKIYFGSGFWYDPSDSAIHSTDDNVVINSAGEITAKGASILGNSSFKGSFDCTAIKTAIASPYVQASATTTVINKTQGRNLAGTIRGLALGTGKIPARISGVTSAVAYVDYQYTESSAGSIYKVNFYNSSYTLLDIRNILSCTSSGNHSDNYSICYYSPNIGSERYTYANSSFTVEFMAGGNTLLLDIPSSATGLTSGMVYRDGSSLKVVP